MTGRTEFVDMFRSDYLLARYHLVLQIFYQHARSREARLQVALAEIPYLKNRLMIEQEYERGNKHSGSRLGEQYYDTQRFVLKQLEGKIRARIGGMREQRQRLRRSRKQSDLPTVAVLGYTNCGKTSLIKAITEDDNMEAKDQLFATLDVTCHGTRLPRSNLDTVFIDTVGFISDIPTALIASFSATLEDALDADLLLHVADFSNPDVRHQISQVEGTLARLKVEVGSRLVCVGNKIDKIPTNQWRPIMERGFLPVSATQGHGLNHLLDRLEERLISVTDRLELRLRLRPGGEEWEWLRQHSALGEVEQGEEGDTNIVHVVISRANMERFKRLFVTRL